MRSPGSARSRRRVEDDDVIARLQSMLDREQIRRRNLTRAGVIATCVALVLVVGAVVLARGNASAATRTGPVAVEPVQRVAETTPISTPESATTASAPSAEAAPAEPAVESPAAGPSVAVKPKQRPKATPKPAPEPEPQRFRIAIGSQGYEPGVIRASAGAPVILRVGRGEGCAAGFLIPELGVDEDNSGGPVTINLGRVRAGRYQFSCGMEMVTGTLIVK